MLAVWLLKLLPPVAVVSPVVARAELLAELLAELSTVRFSGVDDGLLEPVLVLVSTT